MSKLSTNKESLDRYIITRDFELSDGRKGRQCWTGEVWSQEMEQVRVYHNYVYARVVKLNLDEATQRNPKLRVPGLKIMKCDIRKLLPTDLPNK